MIRDFTGRSEYMAALDALLPADHDETAPPHTAVITAIDGAAGIGKTTLAVWWAHRVQYKFADGTLYMNLRGYGPGDPATTAEVLDGFLHALGIPPDQMPIGDEAQSGLFRSVLAGRQVLIVLDNAHHADQVRPLLPGTPGCVAVITSRDSLTGLVVTEGASRLTLDLLTEPEAKHLVTEILGPARAEAEANAVTALVRWCARLPLALRVAASRAAAYPHFTVADVVTELADEQARLDVLSRGGDERAAVRAVFTWSYRALSADAARAFRLFGLHPGTEFSLDAAAALAGDTPHHVRRLLDALVGAHLLDEMAPNRYQFHDLMRAYAADQAHSEEPSAEQRAALRRVLQWYLFTSATAANAIRPATDAIPLDFGPVGQDIPKTGFIGDRDAARWYERERANLMAAVRTAVESGMDRIAWQIPAVLMNINGNRDPLGGWLEIDLIALDAARRISDRRGEAIIHRGIGVRHRLGMHLPEAKDHYENARKLFHALGDQWGVVNSLNGIGLTYLRDGQLHQARVEFERGLTIARAEEALLLVAILVGNLGCVHQELGHLNEAEGLLRQAITAYRELSADIEESYCLYHLANVLIEQRRLAPARESVDRALSYAEAQGNTLLEGLSLLQQGWLELAEGTPENALISSQHAAFLLGQFGYQGRAAEALHVTGKAYQQLGRLDDAADFFRRSAEVQRDLGDRWLLALALDSLATTLKLLNKPDDARQALREAQPLLANIDGPRATELRIRVDHELSSG